MHVTSRRAFRSVLAASLLIVLCSRTALAQSTITGEVTDSSGAAISGVTVQATSPALIERSRIATTSSDGRYTIIDVRLQTMGMSEQQALDLMVDQTFQEKEEATAKLQRAQLSSCQLPTYYAGVKGWLQARDRFRLARGTAFSLRDFHERALRESAVPLPELEKLLH